MVTRRARPHGRRKGAALGPIRRHDERLRGRLAGGIEGGSGRRPGRLGTDEREAGRATDEVFCGHGHAC